MHRIRSTRLTLALVVTIASVGVGCGGDDPDDGDRSAAGPETTASAEPVDAKVDGRAVGGAGLIVFRRLDSETGKARLYTVRADGSGLSAITFPGPNQDEDSQADFSPDGRLIVFRRFFNVGEDGERTELLLVRPDGNGLRNLTRVSCSRGCLGSEEPAFSPDGRRIAFMRALGPLSPEGFPATVGVFVMNADGSEVRQLTQLDSKSGTEDHHPTWSPDGRRIAFMRVNATVQPENASAIYTVDAEGGEPKLLRRMPRRWPGAGAPDWSPDGRRIVFSTYCAFGDCGQPPTGAQLFTVDANGGRPRQLTRVSGNAYNPRWSPDGKHVVFARNPQVGPVGDVYTIRANGTGPYQLTDEPESNAHYPDWGRVNP